ncbi:FBD domain-containing protein [Hirschfeldia incana]|nr:FBD domain-containing protein [Hirschfeldia incana]
MYLEYIEFPNEATFETLVLCSPVLEWLKVVVASDDENVFRVHSRSLKRLTFERVSPLLFDSAGVVIDAPRLCVLTIKDNVSKSFIIHNLASNAVLEMSLLGFVRLEEIDDEFFDHIYEEGVSWSRSNIHKFLHGISMAKTMKISRGTFKLMCHYSKLEPLPQFGNMSYLDITLCLHDFKWLPAFLESFPNLEYLVLVCDHRTHDDVPSEDVEQVSFSSVPECLLSSLEYVDLKAPVQYDVEMKLVKCLLKNSAVLEKLILRLASSNSRRDDMLKKLLKIRRASTKCKVVIL